jgi:hypothetical protein
MRDRSRDQTQIPWRRDALLRSVRTDEAGAIAETTGLNRLRKKAVICVKSPKNIPQGLKPIFYYLRLAARLKSCPCYKTCLN